MAVHQVHPGNYVFFDRQQAAVGACGEGDVAVTVLTRIVGHYAAHMLCDAGALALSKDTAPQARATPRTPRGGRADTRRRWARSRGGNLLVWAGVDC